MYRRAELTQKQNQDMEVCRVTFMNKCPFLAYLFYDTCIEWPTRDIDTAGTDGRRIFYNPDFMDSLAPAERVFVFAHEMYHVLMHHSSRMKHYERTKFVRELPYDHDTMNRAMDYVINYDLVDTRIGAIPKKGLYDEHYTSAMLPEDVYEKIYKKPPVGPDGDKKEPPAPGGAGGQEDGKSNHQQAQHIAGDPGEATPNGTDNHRFDDVRPPLIDPVTGSEDLPDEGEFREAVARAAAAAKAQGNMPGNFQLLVDELLEPQISWREHIRMLVTGRIGNTRETWDRLDRRRLALAQGDPSRLVGLPGRRGYGAKEVAVVIDNSGSVGDKELAAFFAEIGGILQDVRPRTIWLIHCDASVNQVDECRSLAELEHLRVKGSKGGGGTNFKPPFEYLEKNGIVPECLVYLTDLLGTFPKAPSYPVIWAATTDRVAPFGDTVKLDIKQAG